MVSKYRIFITLTVVPLLICCPQPTKAGETSAPHRIITIAPNSAETICALGLCDQVVGVSKFCNYPRELAQVPRVGGLFDPDIERIIALRPDLIILRGHSDSVARLCRQHNIPLHIDHTESLGDVEGCVLELGKLLGRSKQAESLVAGFRKRLGEVRQRVADRPRPCVFLTVSRNPDRLANILTTGKGTFLDEMIGIAGGINAFGHLDMAYPQVGPEAIIARQPDVIIEFMPERELTPELERQMRAQWASLGPIPAIRDGRLWFIADDHCLIPSLRYVEIVERVSKILHPVEPSTSAP